MSLRLDVNTPLMTATDGRGFTTIRNPIPKTLFLSLSSIPYVFTGRSGLSTKRNFIWPMGCGKSTVA